MERVKAESERGQTKRRKLWKKKDNVEKLECKGMADEYENMRYMMERFSSQTFFIFFLFLYLYKNFPFFPASKYILAARCFFYMFLNVLICSCVAVFIGANITTNLTENSKENARRKKNIKIILEAIRGLKSNTMFGCSPMLSIIFVQVIVSILATGGVRKLSLEICL